MHAEEETPWPDSHAFAASVRPTARIHTRELAASAGLYSNGSHWKQSVVQTIRDIESGAWEFYVQEDGLTAGLIVAKHEGHKYIKTTADGIQPDNLLSLAECP
ncbi:DUF3892 domain-containing protein [Bradyrhizobium sp. RP6]|uniref:DUF3892 domain-containing protein n=1 Tax=Bradyrhizobium sp. RP6 TaxID=2489596 RepID=UPI001FE1599F|nr:DUF3892 domain-containing protein [Bradyrhizobium sp. RP6]